MEKKITITEVAQNFIKPDFKETDYIFGSGQLLGEIIQFDGQWITPEEELQIKKTETSNCTAFATTSIFEILFKRQFNLTKNYSDRLLGIFAGTYPPGNSPSLVVETARKKGLAPEELLPFSDQIERAEQYYSYEGGNQYLCEQTARQFSKEWMIGYDWVANGRSQTTPESIMEALKYSPLGVAVFAWAEQDGKYIRTIENDIHYTIIVGYKKNDYWLIFDSYAPFLKKLDWNFGFKYVMRYSLKKNTVVEQISLIERILSLMRQLVSYLIQEKKQDEIKVIKSLSDVIPPPANKETMRGMVERICEEEGIPQETKIICAVIQVESGFDPRAKNENKNSQGRVVSTDWGIAQINDYYWIGSNKTFPSVEYVLENPEKCVRWMVKQWKLGHQNWWIAYKNGSYKKYLLKVAVDIKIKQLL
mgnify:CR=1 FL=1